MRFSTFIVATGLLATSVMAVPNPAPEAEPKLVRAGKFGYWCVAPGQMCYKNKRDLDEAKTDIIAGYEPYTPEHVEKREASPEAAPLPKRLVRAGKFGYWCVAPGQMCYKNKRDLETVKEHIAAGQYAPLPSEFEE